MKQPQPARSVFHLMLVLTATCRLFAVVCRDDLNGQIARCSQRLFHLLQRLCLVLLLIATPTHAESVADFRVQVLEDPTQKMLPANVLQALQDGQFQELPDQHFSAGYSDSVFWLWWEPRLPATTATYYLNLDYPLLQSVMFYGVSLPNTMQQVQIRLLGQSGSALPAQARAVLSTSHYFPIQGANPSVSGYLMRLESQTSLSVPLRIVSESQLMADQRHRHLWYGFIIGTMTLLIFYNLFVAWWIKEPANAIYLLFLSGLLFVFISVSGIASTYISPALGGSLLWLLPLMLHLVSVSSYLFAKQYFSNSLLPRFYLKALAAGAWFSAALMLTTFLLDYQTAMMLAMLNALLMVLLLFILAATAFYLKIPGSPLFLLGKIFVLAGGFIQFAKTVALIPATGLTEYILFLGVILEAIVLTGGLALKTKTLEQEQAMTRAELLNIQQTSLQELTQLNQVLAKEVQEKTQSESIQKALFTINELAAGNEDMHSFLHQVHQVVGNLMFARNFFVALYHPQQQCVQFAYFADEEDTDIPQPTDLIPAERLAGSWTMWVIEHGEILFGNCAEIEQQTKLAATFGSIAKYWLGIPLRDEQGVIGVLVVQIYHDQPSYTPQERKLLDFVSQHISSAVQRKQYRRNLELQVQERTQELRESFATLNTMHQQLSAVNLENQAHLQQVQTLLDNTGQGFLTCNQALEIQPSFSKECLQIFNTDALTGSIVDLFAKDQPAFHALLTDVLCEVLQPTQSPMMVTTYLSLLPAQLTFFERLYQIEYKRLAADRLMVILSDITEKTKLATALQQQQEQANFIVYALNHPDEVRQVLLSFQHFLQIASSAPQSLCSATGLTELYRQIHTFKSLLAQIRCPALPGTLHEIEDRLQGLQESAPQQIAVQETVPFALLDSQLQAALKLLERQLPAHLFEQDPHLPLPRRLHQDVLDFLESHHSELAQQLREVQFQTFSSLLRPHFEMALMLAQSQGKLLSAIRFEGEDPKLDAEYYQPFFQVLVHLFRNAIDHGIESPGERSACGKPAVATIRCQLQREGAALKLTISDDGRGIALEQVRQKALALQLLDQHQAEQWSAEQIAQFIFADALSTKAEINLVSGRGIGLAAVKQQLANFDASIRVTSEQGQGCTFTILLPIKAEFLTVNRLHV
jgi:two-component system chemotaxis sensor kinase CheA